MGLLMTMKEIFFHILLHDTKPLLRALTLAVTMVVVCSSVVVASGDFWTTEPRDFNVIDKRGAAVEEHLGTDDNFNIWAHDPSIYSIDQGDRVETQQVVQPALQTVKLDNLVPPILFPLGVAEIPDETIAKLRVILDNMRDRLNVRLHFVGHTDNLQLRGELVKRFGDNIGLSRERAGTTAEHFQKALSLPPEAISYEGLGESQPIATNTTEAGRALNRRVEVEVWYDIIGQKTSEEQVVVSQDINRLKVCRTETVCKLRYRDGQERRARIKNVVAPLHYDRGLIQVPEEFLDRIDQAIRHMGHKENIVVKFIAYSDSAPLNARDQRIYGDHEGFTKAVALRVALSVKDQLGLAEGMTVSDGQGDTRPVASNDTAMSRTLNRRVEVEFWYDDPLQELADEPRLCPDAAGAETITRIYNSPSGDVPPILFRNGSPYIPGGYPNKLKQIMSEINDKDNVRLRFVGYTNNEALDRRTAAIYGDDIGWSTARAHRTLLALSDVMGMDTKASEFEGRGFVQSDDVVTNGFIESDTSRVEVEVVYDELVPLDDYEGVDVLRLNREVTPVDPLALNHMRITVNGKPVDDPGKSIADVQRCTDVALDSADIQFKYDDLNNTPRLNVTAWPRSIRLMDDPETDAVDNLVQFKVYTNYQRFIERAEIRVFDDQQSVHDVPAKVIDVDDRGLATWVIDTDQNFQTEQNLKYVVRVYDAQGHYDETQPQPLWLVEVPLARYEMGDPSRELLVGYGESRLARQEIPIEGGTISAYGSSIPDGHDVWLGGSQVPVDNSGQFVVEEILPSGLHTVEVAVLDEQGNGELFLRDLELKQSDWFYVGVGDVTLSANDTDDNGSLISPDNDRYSEDVSVEGRLAFFTKGRFENGWELKASADTREGPFDEIFSNFLDKSPDSLFRRLDPKYYYPTFGDDSHVLEEAPTYGKFFLKLSKNNNYGLWGNFNVAYTENQLAHVDRGLYGANLHYQTPSTTSFGEQRLVVDGFAADPGTVGGRDEFRGTGGSLYYLQQQDILVGSERLRVEIRDKDSGMVLGVKNLAPSLDYTVDYLQGRIMLTQPLETTAQDELLVRSESLNGNPVFLVARYEFTPGVEDVDALSTGGQIHYWLNDFVKFGLTANQDEYEDDTNDLYGADVTFRKSPGTWLKLEAGQSKGLASNLNSSVDGGYDFDSLVPSTPADKDSSAYRVESSVDLGDFTPHARGRFTLYYQEVEGGYIGPGLVTGDDVTKYGATASIPVQDWLQVHVKADRYEQSFGLETTAAEIDVDARLIQQWTLSSGVRFDSRNDQSVAPVPTQEEGDRTDAVVRLQYDSLYGWTGYGFVQETMKSTGNRDDNFRVGAGGSYQVTDRFRLSGEVSGGDLGAAGRLGTEYLYTDRTTLYMNYALENERSDNGLRARKGNLTSGAKTRYSDSLSMYVEERYTHGDVPTGLMHATGVDLAPNDRINLGGTLDYGTLKDRLTGAELERTAAGVRAGYGYDRLSLSGALEYRVDDIEHEDTSKSKRTTWLVKFDLKYQMSADWRLISKLHYANSDSSEGDLYNGEFTEAVLGYAYRPVFNDRLNALVKYTYFYNLPSFEQVNNNTTSTVIQKSHIASIDVGYELNPQWSVGGKYAYRLGQVSLDRVNPTYFDSQAHLYVVRLDWHALHRWDALLEARMLDLPDAEDQKTGVLIGVYRHIGNHVKLGLGYNFSDFSDDLTDLSYDHQGVFINLIGKF
jgi:flagellar motor protein MotB